MNEIRVACVGTAVCDCHVQSTIPEVRSDKQECHMRDSLGGGAIQAARQVRAAGIQPFLVALVGNDVLGTQLATAVHGEFPGAVSVPGMHVTRRSILEGDRCLTQRSPINLRRLPIAAEQAVSQAQVSVIAPFAAEDSAFVLHLLDSSRKPVLLLSHSQLAAPQLALQLARCASYVVVNESELQTWTGQVESIADGLRWLTEEQGLRRVVVTHTQGVTASLDGEWLDFTAPLVSQSVRTIGAGDTFAGELAVGLARELPHRTALGNALQAAALYVRSPDQTPSISEWPIRKPISDSRAVVAPQTSPYASSAIAAATLMIGLGLGVFVSG